MTHGLRGILAAAVFSGVLGLVAVRPAAAHVQVVHTDSLGCEWAGASSVTSGYGQGQTSNWNGSTCLVSAGVWLDTFCDWTGCWGYSWKWQSGNFVSRSTAGDPTLGNYIHNYHQITTAALPTGSQIIQTSTN